MPAKRSRIHPKYKTKCRVSNWASYDRSLVRRGDVTLWFAPKAIDAWSARPTGRRGAQSKFSDMAIDTEMDLPTSPFAGPAMLGNGPLPFAERRQAAAFNEQVEGVACRLRAKIDQEAAPTAG